MSKEQLLKYMGTNVSDELLKDRISYLGTDLESIENGEITVEIFPNRPDLLSLPGFARALSSFIGKKIGLKEYSAEPSKEKVIVEKAAASVRPYTACAIVRGLIFDDEKIKEVIDIQEKLHITFGRNRKKVAIGIYPLEKISLPIRFTTKKPEDIVFQPLEGTRKMNAREILRNHPAGKKYGHLLEGKDMFPVFIDADDKVLSMPPIINSHDVGKITKKTSEVFIECSGFDYGMQHQALVMIATALSDMGGKIYSMTLDYPDGKKISPNLAPREISADLGYLNKRLGLELTEKKFKALIERMGFGYKGKKVLIPCYRSDILHQIDIAEDVAIAYGYENFNEIIPKVATIAMESKREVIKNKVADLLVGLGFLEASTYALSSKDYQSTLMAENIKPIELANAISQEYNVLRAWLLPSLMEVLKANAHREYPQKIFTAGIVFRRDPKEETGVGEDLKLGLVSCHENAGYTESRQYIDYLLKSLGIAKFSFLEHDSGCFISGRASKVILDGKTLAVLGEVHPQALTNWGLAVPCCAAELNLEVLFWHLGITKKI